MRLAWLAALVVGGTASTNPIVLDAADKAAALCTSLQPTERVRFKEGASSVGEQRAAYEDKQKAAREQVYQLTLQGNEFQVSEIDPAQATIAIDTTRPFRGLGGALTIYDIEVDELVLHADPQNVTPAREAVRAKRANLVITFKVAADEDSPCFASTAKAYILASDFVSAELRDGATVLARAVEEDGFAPARAAAGKPTVDVVAIGGEGGAAVPAEITAHVQKVKPDAQRCYEKALAKDPSIDGSVVFGWVVKAGKPVPSVQAESVQDDDLVRCLTQAMANVAAPSAKKIAVAIHLARQ